MKHTLPHALLLSAFVAFASPALAAPENYAFDPAHTTVEWTANHFGFSNPTGKFSNVQGTLTLDEQKPEASKVEVTIDVANNLFTGLEKFDAHIKSPDFLDAAKFPKATFVSDKVEVTGKTTAKVSGQLTLHGVTKPVVLDVTLNKIGEHPMSKKKTVGFNATTTLKRSDFGVSYGVPGVADEIKIDITSEASVTG